MSFQQHFRTVILFLSYLFCYWLFVIVPVQLLMMFFGITIIGPTYHQFYPFPLSVCVGFPPNCQLYPLGLIGSVTVFGLTTYLFIKYIAYNQSDRLLLSIIKTAFLTFVAEIVYILTIFIYGYILQLLS